MWTKWELARGWKVSEVSVAKGYEAEFHGLQPVYKSVCNLQKDGEGVHVCVCNMTITQILN